MMPVLSPLSTVEEWLAPTRDTTTSDPIGPQFLKDVKELSIYVRWSAGAVSGTVIVEGASQETYTGKWSSIVRVNCTGGGQEDWRAITGVHGAIRFRVVDPPIGGDVSVWVVGN